MKKFCIVTGYIFIILMFLFVGCGVKDTNIQREEPDIVLTEVASFTRWSESALYLHSKGSLFEGWEMAEYVLDGQQYPVLYNDEIQLIIFSEYLWLQKVDETQIFQYPIGGLDTVFAFGDADITLLDMNRDGVKDIAITAIVGKGTGALEERIYLIDGRDDILIPVEYGVGELASRIESFTIAEDSHSEGGAFCVSVLVDGNEISGQVASMGEITVEELSCEVWKEWDVRECMADGTIRVETLLAVWKRNPFPEAYYFIGTVQGILRYEQENNMFVLDEDSITVDFYEDAKIY